MPDETAYITVPIDTSQETLRDDAIAELQSLVPGWTPDAGSLERWIIEACAILAAETRDVAAQVPALAFAAWGADMLALPAQDATAATVPSTWTAVDTAGYTIPAGTTVGIRAAGDELIGFRVATAASIPPGDSATAAGAVILEAVEAGAAASGITGTVELIDALAGISTVAVTEPSSGGQDAETGSEYLDRLRVELQSLTFTPILPADFARQALTVPGVGRAVATDLYDPGSPVVLLASTFDATAESWTGNALSGWHAAADVGVSRVTTAPRTGAGHLLIDVDNSGGGATSPGGHVTVTPAAGFDAQETYTCEMWVRLASATGTVRLLFGSSTTDRAQADLAATTAYQKVTVDWTADADSATATVALVIAPGVPGHTVADAYIDDVLVTGPNYAAERAVTVTVAGEDGQPCSSGVKSAVDGLLQGRREANFVVAVADPRYRTVDVTFEAVAVAGYDIALVETAAADAVAAYLDPAAWGVQQAGSDPAWDELTHVRYLDVAAIIDQVEGINYVSSLTLNGAGADIQLPRPAGLPAAGTITATVTAP